jgi:adapter protein MecA 1/2
MKFEKISDNQIRCTLYKKDLVDRQLKISELAYGSDKANALFRDMLLQASTECDFDAENIPLMIEAIPLSTECLVLLITKVTDPEELDTRFSSFTRSPEDDDFEEEFEAPERSFADEIISCFNHLSDLIGDQLSEKLLGASQPKDQSLRNVLKERETSTRPVPNLCKIFKFDSLDEVISLAKKINKLYHGENTLYKDPYGKYHLIVGMSEHTVGEFNKIVNIISDYAPTEKTSSAGTAFFDEHYKIIAQGNAIEVLSRV